MNLTALTFYELDALRAAVQAEFTRRATPITMAALSRDYLNLLGIKCGDPWRQPTAPAEAYPEGWVVMHEGTRWASLMSGNVFAPPQQWRGLSEGEYPEWTRPASGIAGYPNGFEVKYGGSVWRSGVNCNLMEPSMDDSWTEVA